MTAFSSMSIRLHHLLLPGTLSFLSKFPWKDFPVSHQGMTGKGRGYVAQDNFHSSKHEKGEWVVLKK